MTYVLIDIQTRIVEFRSKWRYFACYDRNQYRLYNRIISCAHSSHHDQKSKTAYNKKCGWPSPYIEFLIYKEISFFLCNEYFVFDHSHDKPYFCSSRSVYNIFLSVSSKYQNAILNTDFYGVLSFHNNYFTLRLFYQTRYKSKILWLTQKIISK